MSGADRAMLYRLAGATGFRQGELRSLTRASFDLSAEDPSISVRAAYSKRRRDDRQPIAPELAAAVVPWLEGKAQGGAVFNLPEPWRIADMIRADAAAARAVWIGEAKGKMQEERAKSTFLADADAERSRAGLPRPPGELHFVAGGERGQRQDVPRVGAALHARADHRRVRQDEPA